MADQQITPGTLIQETGSLLDSLQPGGQLGRYTLQTRIGIGGLGVVFHALDGTDGRSVALKALAAPRNRHHSETLSRFQVQAALLTGLRHHSVVEIQDVGYHDGICFLIMPLVLGPESQPVNLLDYANWFGGLIAPRELLQIYELLLSAFAHFHAHKIVHGNMKPHNVILECMGRDATTWQAMIKVSDFGLSRILGTDFVVESVRKSVRAQDVQAATVKKKQLPPDAKALLQTYDYMSPEQRRGEGGSRRSDVFSLGLMFLHLLTGKKVIGFQPPSRLVRGINGDWDTFILRATNQDKTRRFASVTDMWTALQELRAEA